MAEAVQASAITRKLLAWYDVNQRSFVFRGTRDPYRIWLSEMMLQQTRTETVVPYYERFLQLFPDVFALAETPLEQVLKAWEGLGYYTRARNLHKTANIIAFERGGVFPQTAMELQTLPGIGPYAAAAIASIAFDEAIPAMDGNLNRVISRLFLVKEDIGIPAVKRRLRELGQALMPDTRAGDMNQALMDLGATICLPGTPDCSRCPLMEDCRAFKEADPALLPLMQAKKPPIQVPMGVLLLFCGDRVLLIKRKQALLKGLYVFLLHEGADDAQSLTAAAGKTVPDIEGLQEVGSARHVFTHRVWNMRIYAARAGECVPVAGGIWADAAQLDSLPVPVAMKAAQAQALAILKTASN